MAAEQTEIRLILSRSNTGRWHLQVIDDRSNVRMIQADFDDAAFSDLLATTYGRPIKATLGDLSNVGMYAEHDKIYVPRGPQHDPLMDPAVAAVIHDAQQHGWTAGLVRPDNRSRWVIPLTRWHEQRPEGGEAS